MNTVALIRLGAFLFFFVLLNSLFPFWSVQTGDELVTLPIGGIFLQSMTSLKWAVLLPPVMIVVYCLLSLLFALGLSRLVEERRLKHVKSRAS